MKPQNIKPLEGRVKECAYDNRTDADFPEGFLLFWLEVEGSPLGRLQYLITGKNKPPLMNGHYVVGTCFERKQREGNQVIRIVDNLRIYKCKDDYILAEYRI